MLMDLLPTCVLSKELPISQRPICWNGRPSSLALALGYAHVLTVSRKIKKTKMTPIVLERCRKNGNLGNHYCDDKINFNCFSLFSVSAQVLWGRSIQPQSESWSIASSACAARNAQPVHSAKRECLSTCFQRRRCIRMHPGITNIYIAIIATLFFRLICSLEVWALLCPTMSGQLQSLQSWKTFKKKQGQFQFEDDVYIIKWFLSNHWSKTKTGER